MYILDILNDFKFFIVMLILIINLKSKILIQFLTKPISNLIYSGHANNKNKERRDGLLSLYEIGGIKFSVPYDNKNGKEFCVEGMYFDIKEIDSYKKEKKIKWIENSQISEKKIILPNKILKDKSNCSVLIFCGSSGHYERSFNKISLFLNFGFNVFIINYPGYGNSDGKPTPKTILKACDESFKFIKNKKPLDKILVFGTSLGTGPVSYLASKYDAKFILDRPFNKLSSTSNYYIKKYILPKIIKNNYVGKFFLLIVENIIKNLYEFSNCDYIKKINNPTIMINAINDEMIPTSEISKLENSFLQSNFAIKNNINIKDYSLTAPGGHGWKLKEWYYIDISVFENALEKLGFILIDA